MGSLSAFDLVMEACERMKIETDREARRRSQKPEVERSRCDGRAERNESRKQRGVFVTNQICFYWEITVLRERFFFFCSGKRERVRRDKEKENKRK